MGRQKPRAVLNLSQNHKQFKQRVHILNSALSNQNNIKTTNHNEIDQDSFISLQTKNASTFTPNLMECILFPIFSSSHSTKAIDLIAKHSKHSKNKSTKNSSKSSLFSSSNSNSNFPENLDINASIYMNKGPKPLNQSLDYFTNWETHLLAQNTKKTLNDYINNLSLDDDDYDYDDNQDMPPFIHSHWPATYGDNKDYTKYINPNIKNTQNKESPYDILMLRCAQKCFGDLICNQLTFDDFVRFIENHYNYHFWTYYQIENDKHDKNTKKRKLKLHYNRKIADLCRNINQDIKTSYLNKFVKKEIEFRLLIVMGNKKLLNTERSSHVSSLSLFSIHKSIKKIFDIINMIDLKQIHLLSDNIILKWTQNIRDCMGNIECLLKDIKELKYFIIQYLYEFGHKFKKYLKGILMKIHEKNKKENVSALNINSYFDISLIYIYKTNEQLIHRDIDYDNMYKNGNNIPNENEYEAHIDLELCDFSEYLNYYRYILTVLDEYEGEIINNYSEKLNFYLKYVGGEIKGSIWWRQIWEDRETIKRIKSDQQLSKKLLFLGNNKALTLSLIKSENEIHNINEDGINKILGIQNKVILYIQEILNNKDIDVSCLAIHIKLNLLNNNDYVKLNLLCELYNIIHDRDRPRGKKPETSLKTIKEKAKLLLLKKEELKQKQKKKKIRIQTSEKHLQKLANVAPSASDIQRKYHESILKQRAQKRQRVKQRTKRINELKNRKRKREKNNNNNMSGSGPPALESLDDNININYDEPALKKRRKSSRIESYGGYKKSYLEAEIEKYITYQFEFAIVSNWNAFLKSDIIKKYNNDILSDYNEFKSFLTTLFVGLHVDFEDEYHEYYEGIIEKVRISPKAKGKGKDETSEDDAKTQSMQTDDDDDNYKEILSKYNIKLLIHFKNFSSFWDSWISLPSQRISVLRTYSNAYDVDDNVKPLAEIIRELDEQEIVSIDTISDALQLDRSKFVNWINSQQVEWDDTNTIDKILKWTKKFLISNRQNNNNMNMMIALDYFVKAGNYSNKCEHMICEAVLSNALNVELHSLSMEQINLIQDKVVCNLKNKKYDYFTMANQCGIPLGLFQQIVFGITDLLPQFIIQQVIDWAKGIYLENLDLAIKEEQLFYVKIE